MGNVVMITYAALSHAISVVFDHCPEMLEIARFFKDYQRLRCGCVGQQKNEKSHRASQKMKYCLQMINF